MVQTGILLVDKPAGMTSHDVVGRVRRLFGTRQVGHTGTLDPDATGLLVVLVGRAVKAAEYLTGQVKQYRATLQLGLATDTEDLSGTVLTRCEDLPDASTVEAVLPHFRGEIMQVPPMYSALKVNGHKLVDLARRGVEVERQPRPVTVFELTAAPTDDPARYTLSVTCSAGTYIRTLCADIGRALGCGGAMAALCRISAGGFALSGAVTLDALDGMTTEERAALLLPVERLFADRPAVTLPPFYEKLCRDGCEIYQSKIGTAHAAGARVRLVGENGFFALGEVREYPAGSAIKAIKRFDV